jgi:putative ABC transport system permease protein
VIGAVLGLLLLYAGLAIARPWVDQAFGLWLPIEPPSPREAWTLAGVVGAAALTSLLPALRAYRFSLADGMMVRT